MYISSLGETGRRGEPGVTLLGRGGLWEEAVSNFSSPLPPPAKMSDMEDDFMCDDEEDYDLVRRGERAQGWKWDVAARPRPRGCNFPPGRGGPGPPCTVTGFSPRRAPRACRAWEEREGGGGRPRPRGPGRAQVAGRGRFSTPPCRPPSRRDPALRSGPPQAHLFFTLDLSRCQMLGGWKLGGGRPSCSQTWLRNSGGSRKQLKSLIQGQFGSQVKV